MCKREMRPFADGTVLRAYGCPGKETREAQSGVPCAKSLELPDQGSEAARPQDKTSALP